MQARFFSVFWLNGYQPSVGLKFLRRSTSGSAWLQDSGRVLGDPCREEAHVIPCSSVWLLSAASSLWASGHGDCCVFPTGIQAGTLGIIQDYHKPILIAGLPWWSMVKTPPATAGDTGSISGLETSPGEGSGSPLQYSCPVNHMGRGAWQATYRPWVTKSWTQLCGWTTTTYSNSYCGKHLGFQQIDHFLF